MNTQFRPRKKLGQHFLRHEDDARRIVESIAIQPGDRVIEIGPGEGVLTQFLMASDAVELTCVEVDDRLIPWLEARYGTNPRMRLVHADFLKWPIPAPAMEASKYRVAGNLPYYITSPILFRLLDERDKIQDATVMIQKEVAERLISGPGCKAYGIPSVFFQLYSRVKLLFTVPREAFVPVPEVDSAVISIRFLDEPLVPVQDEDFLKKVVKTVFGQRRKMLRNTLKSFIADPSQLEKIDIDIQQRPEELSPEAFVTLSEKLLENLTGCI